MRRITFLSISLMAFLLTCNLSIGNVNLKAVHSAKIQSGWDMLGDTATIEIPARGVVRREQGTEAVKLEDVIKAGDPVLFQAGYDGNNRDVFQGFISRITPGKYPLKLECEDEFYRLKRQGSITKAYETTTLRDLLRDLIPDAELAEGLPSITLSNFLVDNATRAEVLQELSDAYGLAVYYRGGQLYVGLPYFETIEGQPVFGITENVADDQLEFQKREQIQLAIRAVSIQPDGSKVEAQVGNAGAETRTLYYYNITSKRKLKTLAAADLERYKYSGYRGNFTAFGIPKVVHSQIITLRDKRFRERTGDYLVKSVRTQFGPSSFRQTIELGPQV